MDGSASLAGCYRPRPENVRLGDGMGGILGYARVSTGDQDVAGQTMRLTVATLRQAEHVSDDLLAHLSPLGWGT